MLYTYIYTDDIQSNYELFEYIYCTKSLQFAGSSNDPAQVVLSIFSEKKPDIVFIDTEMKNSAAIQLYKMLSALASVIFITSDTKNYESLVSSNLSCICKPYNYPRFLELLSGLNFEKKRESDKTIAPQGEEYFFIKGDRGKIVRIDIPEILFIEGSQNYITIHKRNEKHITYLTLKQIEKALPEDSFIRIHKSFIVNMHKVKVVENSHVTLDNKIEIALGSSYKERFLIALGPKVVKSERM